MDSEACTVLQKFSLATTTFLAKLVLTGDPEGLTFSIAS